MADRKSIQAAIETGTSDEARGVRALRRFMCCEAGREMVDVGLIRPFLHSLPYVPEADRDLYKQQRDELLAAIDRTDLGLHQKIAALYRAAERVRKGQ